MFKKIVLAVVCIVACAVAGNNQQKVMDRPKVHTIKVLTGAEIGDVLPFIATQRIIEFRDYPYLYEGDYNEEILYLREFSQLPNSAVAVAYFDDEPVGFITGTAVSDFEYHFKGSMHAMQNSGIDPFQCYYFAECIVMPEHRGHQLSKKLFDALEKHAATIGFSIFCMATESHDVHPLKPQDYASMDTHWQHIGYTKSAITVPLCWPTIQLDGTIAAEQHILTYWFKTKIVCS